MKTHLSKKAALFAALIILVFSACKPPAKTGAIIKGDIKGLHTKMVYLSKIDRVNSAPFDSAVVTDGKFEFNISPDTLFEPDYVRITYSDSGKLECIFATHKDAEITKNGPIKIGGFIMEPGLTEFKGDLSTADKNVVLTAGPQNSFFFKNYHLPYKRISADSAQKQEQIDHINKLIKDMPDAFYALEAVGNLEFKFNRATLQGFYNAMSNQLQNSYKGQRFKTFIDNIPADTSIFAQSHFVDDAKQWQPVLDSTKKLNMVIFWASWCGPCRQEIPSLKKIYAQVPANEVHFVSVSIDRRADDWEKAMAEEKMPWQQLMINPTDDGAYARYNLEYIPQIYLVDRDNRVVKKIDGFDEGNDKIITSFINNYVAKN